MNNKKIAFITASNVEAVYQECTAFIKQLEIPEGYETELICIRGAVSMASAYNQAIGMTDAKYKIYMHQDSYLIYSGLLRDMLHIFALDEDIGLIGVLGGTGLPQSGEMLNAWNCGRTLAWNGELTLLIHGEEPVEETGFLQVEAVDGMFMATNRDILWREDLFDGWDFYDISQSYEFRRRGYKAVVPFQRSVWCLHDCGPSNMQNYEKYRKILKQEYKDFLGAGHDRYVSPHTPEFFSSVKKITDQLDFLAITGYIETVFDVIDDLYEVIVLTKGLEKFRLLEDIYYMEKRAGIHRGFCASEKNLLDVYSIYTKIKRLLYRLEYDIPEAERNLMDLLNSKDYSVYAFYSIMKHSCWDYKKLKRILENAFLKTGKKDEAELFAALSFVPAHNRNIDTRYLIREDKTQE